MSCTGATVSWVSSELQLADGMTKQSAPTARAKLHSLEEKDLGEQKTEPDALRTDQTVGSPGNVSSHNNCALH